MTYAGVLDWLNGNGGTILAVIVGLSVLYLFGLFTNEKDRCPAQHPRYGRCRLKRMHKGAMSSRKHVNWNGQSWYD